jgi:hypothetical protein
MSRCITRNILFGYSCSTLPGTNDNDFPATLSFGENNINKFYATKATEGDHFTNWLLNVIQKTN